MINVFIFIAADNNLDKAATIELKNILSSSLCDEYRVLIEVDRYPSYIRKESEKRITRRYLITSKETQVLKLSEQNTGDPDTLYRFIKWGLSEVPAQNNYLVIWGHGHGWPGVADDFTSKDELTLPELSTVLKALTDEAHFNIIGFDACMMACIEVAYAMIPFTEILIASQGLADPDGWHYQNLFRNTPENIYQFCTIILKEYDAYYRQKGKEDYTISLIKTESIINLSNKLCLLAETCITDKKLNNALYKARKNCVSFEYGYADISDFIKCLTRIALDKAVQSLCQEIQTIISSACPISMTGSQYRSATGLSVYFPIRPTQNDLALYAETSFCRHYPVWLKLIMKNLSDFEQ
jgi:hypothetical protein